MANRLAEESSPYLLQHADNPVDWYPWGSAALEKAKEEDKPILLSIGYAACHWCHVMAHESFEDEATARFMNEHFVNVKVDREERPDLDSLYMNAVVALTGQGGWPMTVLLTPQGEPFYGGTYFPPAPRYGMPSFQQVLVGAVRAWQERRMDVVESAGKITEHIGRNLPLALKQKEITAALLEDAETAIERQFEPKKGGFGTAPKFPQAMTIEFLLRRYMATGNDQLLHMATYTLDMMARGGIYDHLGGGFARYSTDDKWLVPHFEKMLYDNALLAEVYAHAWQLTGEDSYRRISEETLNWVRREMGHPDGGFFSSLDADSEGVEGRFYIWEEDEIKDVLEDDADLFLEYYGVSENGNWEGTNILAIEKTLADAADSFRLDEKSLVDRLSEARQRLYEVRTKRVWPGLDEKVLTSWNGLSIRALAEAGRAFDRPEFVNRAIGCAEFIFQTLRKENGRLMRTWRDGSPARYNGYLEDYAYLADGLISLYQATFDEKWIVWSEEIAGIILDHFRDTEQVGFYDTSDDHEALIQRPKNLQDNATPSGGAAAALVLLKLSLFNGNLDYWDVALEAVASMTPLMRQSPTAFAHWLCAADFILSSPLEVAIVGDPMDDDTKDMIAVAFKGYRPNQIVAAGEGDSDIPLLQNRRMAEGQPTAYVCRRFVCSAPVTEPGLLAEQLSKKDVVGQSS